MLVLHGFWAVPEGLCLWAEDSGLTVASGSHALRSARPHPFAAPASVLTTLHAGKPARADLLLPSLRTAPLDSPELIRTTPRPAARAALSAGLRLAPPRRGRLPARLPATEAWLTALTGPDGRFDAGPGELSALARGLAPWEDIGTGRTGPARATFRLAEVPAEPD